ncbi:YmfQ family protein [Neisseria blantyrii]|uniref:YmfQ family protein n=1 Tax=Neisseria blantyrii TaxID=2830647 RepID=UPI002659E949|nr:putative phage tail protein [Neisseria blantyrii]
MKSYADVSASLLPPVSYARNGARVAALMRIDGNALDAVNGSAQEVADLPFPGTQGSDVAAWERVLGLDGAGRPRAARVAAVLAKLNETGGLSIPYFTAMARAAGYAVSIEEPQPFRAGIGRAGGRLAPEDVMFVWRVHVGNRAARVWRFRTGVSAAGDALGGFADDVVETVFNDLKPAHTAVHFVYET